MSDDAPQVPDKLTGRCLCRALRYTTAEKPLVAGLCHGNRHRPQSGTAFSTVVFVHRRALTIIGETAVFEDIGTSGLRVFRPLLAALRFASDHRARPDARTLHDQGRDKAI
jgi:hypothetical protein